VLVAESVLFAIGAPARCEDGICGRVTQVVVDPIRDRVTHIVVEPEHREGLGRLVPIDKAEPSAHEVRIKYTKAELDTLRKAEQTRFLPGVEGSFSYAPEEVLLWPYFGGNSTVPVTMDTLPAGDVAVSRGEEVHATDGRIGEVEGLIVDSRDHNLTHLVLKEGHLFGRKDVAIPIGSVKAVDEDGVQLSISKSDVEALPAVDFSR
jgi:sporulation protein YlmC with PRC-barrel domain